MKSTKTEDTTTSRQLPAEVHELADTLAATMERSKAAAEALTEAERDYTAAARTPGAQLATLNKLRAARESARTDATTLAEHVEHLQAAMAQRLADLLARQSPVLRAARDQDRATRDEAQKHINEVAQNLLIEAQRANNEIKARRWATAQNALLEEVRPMIRLCPPDLRDELLSKAYPSEHTGPTLPLALIAFMRGC